MPRRSRAPRRLLSSGHERVWVEEEAMRGAGGMGGINLRLMMQAWRLQALEARLLAAKGALSEAELRARASEKLRQGANLTRAEVAAVIGVSVKKVQRMDAAGTLSR